MEDKRLIWLLNPSHLVRAPVYNIELLWNWFCCIFGSDSCLSEYSHTSEETHMRNILVLQAGMPSTRPVHCSWLSPWPRVTHTLSLLHQHNTHRALTSRIYTLKLNHRNTLQKKHSSLRRKSPVPADFNHVLPEPAAWFSSSKTKPLKGWG